MTPEQREQARRLVMKALSSGPMPTTDIVNQTGMTKCRVKRACRELVDNGAVEAEGSSRLRQYRLRLVVAIAKALAPLAQLEGGAL